MVLAGFFLPWLNGSSQFASREFSGFDLARLVRNFEIVASSSSEAGPLRLTAAALYAVPALAVNGAVLAQVQRLRRAGGVALCVAGSYGLVMLLAVALLSNFTWTQLDRVLGGPMSGYFVSLFGLILLSAGGSHLALGDPGTSADRDSAQ